MSASVRVLWDDTLAAYDFGPSHPLAPLRVELTVALCRELGVFALPGVEVVPAPVADDALLRLVHSQGYVDAVRACAAGVAPVPAFGLGTEDTPVFPRMHEAAAHVVGATVECARTVWTGEAPHAVSLAGGLHHAMPDTAAGFCVYNDVAVAIAWLLENGARRVVYVDVDAHHGDGVEAAFRDDPRVMTISLHQTGRELFPGTGFVNVGGDDPTVVNVPLPARTDDAGWSRVFEAVVPPLVEAFAPDVLVTQQGCDGHRADPLTNLRLTVDGQRATYARLHELAHAHAGGRWVATGGGGYSVVDVVPRAWTHLVAEAAGRPLAAGTEVPARWRALVETRTGLHAPLSMTDLDGVVPSPAAGVDEVLDDVIREVRRHSFPAHGLAP